MIMVGAMNHLIVRWSVGCVLICIGAILYILFRPDALFGGLPHIANISMQIPEWIIYTFPDALWYASLLCFMRPLTVKRGIPHPLLTILALLGAPTHEFLQLFNVVPGTYCPYDMQIYIIILISYTATCLFSKSKQSKRLYRFSHSLHSWS